MQKNMNNKGNILLIGIGVIVLILIGAIVVRAVGNYINVEDLYCDDGNVWHEGTLYVNCISGVEECKTVYGIAQCVEKGDPGEPADSEDGDGLPGSKDARCSDGIDNDNDGYIDCDDYDCSKDDTVTVCEAEPVPEPDPEPSELYCQWGDVYLDGQEVTNCWSDREECQIVDGIAQCVTYGDPVPDPDPEPVPGCTYPQVDGYYCQWGDVFFDGAEAQNCWSDREECQLNDGCFSCVLFSDGGGGDPTPGDGTLNIVATYENIGISWQPQNMGPNQEATIQYKVSETLALAGWKDALNLWYDNRMGHTPEYRGSILRVKECTSYDIMGILEPNGETFTQTVKTRCPAPEGQTFSVPAQSSKYTITQGGTAEGLAVYDCGGNTVDSIDVNANFVKVKNCVTIGGEHGIDTGDYHDIVIEFNDISGWGNGGNRDAGVKAGGVWDGNRAGYRITIQWNEIHDPSYGSQSWDDGHPSGPQAVDFADSYGENVIRWNSAYSTNGNKFNDVFGGEHNKGPEGFPGPNSDIYGNYIANAWDDGIEAEGSGENVRIYNNYMTDFAIGIANVDVNEGPIYNFENAFDVSYRSESDPGKSGVAFKLGDLDGTESGRNYMLHNTVLQDRDGVGAFAHRTDGGFQNGFIANNVAPLRSGNSNAHINPGDGGCNNYADYDLYTGNIWNECANQEQNGFKQTPTWDQGSLYNYPDGRQFKQTLASGTPGVDAGIVLPNVNDGYSGSAPDMGAVERGSSGFCFGHNCGQGIVLSFINIFN